MMRKISSMVVLLLAGGLTIALAQVQKTNPKSGAASAQTAPVQKDVPAELNSGISQLLSAKSSLEKAGDKWGGHRVQAIAFIDQALKELGHTQPSNRHEMDSGPKDEPAALQAGINALQAAKADFSKAGDQWGGKKAKAVSLVDQALKELQLGIDYAKSHGTY
jgi:hypothetical protein